MGRPARGQVDRRTGGFALVAVLLVMVGLSGLAAAGYLMSSTDYRINQNHLASVKAFYVADAGLDHFLGRGKIRADTVRFSHPDGEASVWLTPLLDVDGSSSLFVAHSLGEHRPPEGGVARRHVSTIVLHRAAAFKIPAAITAAAGLRKNGASGTVSGFDAATPDDCPLGGTKNVAGLVVPEGGFEMKGGGKGGGAPPGFFGEPPVLDEGTALEILEATGIPWKQVLDGTYAEADYVVSVDGYPDFSEIGEDEWPLIYIDVGSYSVNPTKSGQGALVVQEDLKINGNFRWKGVMLLGGELTSNGVQRISGAVITGLNLLLEDGESDGVNVGNGNWVYQYNACNVMNALKGIGWPVEEPGTWYEVM